MLQALARSLIVSCQPVVGGPLDRADIVAALACAALDGGATGLRIEGEQNLRAVRAAVADSVPIIGLIKRDLADSPVRITPFSDDVTKLANAGADIIAFDATERPRPETAAKLCEAAHHAGKLAMADIANLAEATAATAFGVDLIGTTLSGYTGGPEPDTPDLELVRQLTALGLGQAIIAEGRIKSPQQARLALDAGAFAVVVGSAITRPEYVTGWFIDALNDDLA